MLVRSTSWNKYGYGLSRRLGQSGLRCDCFVFQSWKPPTLIRSSQGDRKNTPILPARSWSSPAQWFATFQQKLDNFEARHSSTQIPGPLEPLVCPSITSGAGLSENARNQFRERSLLFVGRRFCLWRRYSMYPRSQT